MSAPAMSLPVRRPVTAPLAQPAVDPLRPPPEAGRELPGLRQLRKQQAEWLGHLSPLNWNDDWAAHGRCRGLDPEMMFADAAQQKEAVSICRTCPVVARCLGESLDARQAFGVWGGMTERQRRQLLRHHSDVTSWTEIFRAASARLEASQRDAS
jgi:WhiB family transcriptional regulator, redox-sensing transcriptional regulator